MRLLFTVLLMLGLNLLAEVSAIKIPDGGISPQCVTDSAGNTHVIYYKGAAQTGDLFYAVIKKGSTELGSSVRINSQPGSAVAIGTIRAAHLAIGQNNSVHVVWNGSEKAKGQLLYSQSTDAKTFSPQKDMKGATGHMDGGASVAAAANGSVYIVWHANMPGTMGEENRRVFVSVSSDNGKSFAKEKAVSPADLGICPCCSLKANARGRNLLILFRGAKGANRDIYELSSQDSGETFQNKNISKWRARQCPMSSQAVSTGQKGFLKAWESNGKIHFASEEGKTMSIAGKGNRKHPVIAENKSGNLLVVWEEGTGWNRGGDICWQEVSSSGRPITRIERAKGKAKVWSLISAYAEGDRFFILH